MGQILGKCWGLERWANSWTHRSGLSPGRGPCHGNRSIELGPGAHMSGPNSGKVPGPGAWRDGETRIHGSGLSPGGVQSHCHLK